MSISIGHVIMPVLGAPDLTEAAIADVLAQSIPVRLLIINQGVEDHFRRRLERIAEQESDRVLLWSHEPRLPSLAATWNRALQFVWQVGGREALVVNNDTRMASHTYEYLSWARHATDALFITAVAVAAEQFKLDLARPDLVSRGGPDFSCFLISKDCHERVQFDERHIPAYAEDLTYHREMMLSGEGHRIFSVNIPYLHVGGGSGTLKSMTPEARATLERRIGQSRQYYERAWGGPPNAERYTIKGDPQSAQDGVTTPELQRACLVDAPADDGADNATPDSIITAVEEVSHEQAVDRATLGQSDPASLL